MVRNICKLNYGIFLLIAISCGKPKDGKEGKVTINLSNETAETELYLQDIAPEALFVKFTYATLREDEDSASQAPIGTEAVIYANASCEKNETSIKVEETEYKHISPGNCDSDGEYFELTRESEKVNASLNAASFPVPPGTYKYLTLCMTGEYKFQTGEMEEPIEVDRGENGKGGCAKADLSHSPIEVNEGDSISLTISYDLATTTSTQAAGSVGGNGCVLSSDEEMEYCVNGADIQIEAIVD